MMTQMHSRNILKKKLLVADVHALQITGKVNSEYAWMITMFKKKDLSSGFS